MGNTVFRLGTATRNFMEKVNSQTDEEARKKCTMACIIEGIITDVVSGVTKNSESYVEATLRDKSCLVGFKNWNITESDFLKTTKITKGKPAVVQINGKFSLFNGKPQFSCDKSNTTLVTRPNALDEYCDCAPYGAQKMLKVINKEIDTMTDEGLKKVCKDFLTQKSIVDKIPYFPYSDEVHTEKGGWLHHVSKVLCLGKARNGEPMNFVTNEDGTPTAVPIIDRDIVITSLVCYNLSALHFMDVDADTGLIMSHNVVAETMFGLKGSKNISNVFRFLDDRRKEYGLDINKLDNIKHCIDVLNNPRECFPCTPEAYYIKFATLLEITMFESCKAQNRLNSGEKTSFTYNGFINSVVRQ